MQFEHNGFTSIFPFLFVKTFVFGLQKFVFTLVVKVTFYFGNLRFLVIVAKLLVEHLQEDG